MLSKKTLLCAAVGLAVSAAASADIKLSPDGLGDAIYVPYFTVEAGNASLITISNHSEQPSTARVVITEPLNGQSTLYFYAFLPPHSVWTAALTADATGTLLTSNSDVCTVPKIPANGVNLRNFSYASTHADGGPTDLLRTRSGAIEVLERGALQGELAAMTVAKDCAGLVTAYLPGNVRSNAVGAPTSQLEAAVQVVQVEQGLVFPVPGVAIKGHSAEGVDRPLTEEPIERFSTPRLATGQSEYVVQTAQGTLAFPANRGPDAISALFMSDRLGGEVHTQAELGASTDWIVSFPTKHAYVARFPGTLVTDQALAPFSDLFDADGSCETIKRRRFSAAGTPRIEAANAATNQRTLCAEQNRVSFGPSETGNETLDFADVSLRTIQAVRLGNGREPVTLRGLPAIGLRLSNFINGQATPGVLANYSVAQPLRAISASVDAN